MENIFVDLMKEENVLVYIDDIIHFTKDEKKPMKILKAVFSLLEENDLRINTEKCELFKRTINYLSQIVDENGIKFSEEKIPAIVDVKESRIGR